MWLFVAALTSMINFILGVVAYLNNPKGVTNRLLAFLAIQISIWSVVNYLSLNQPTEEMTLFWIRLDMVAGAGLGPTMFLLAKTFPEDKLRASKKLLLGLFLLFLITAALALSPFMFTSAVFEGENIRAIPGPAIAVFGLNFVGSLLATFFVIVRKYRRSTGHEKSQIKYLLFGLIATFTLVAITQFFFVIFLGTSFFILFGPTYSLILVGSITYAIVRHRFLEIRVITTEVFSLLLWVVLFLRIFASENNNERIVSTIVLVIVVAFGILLIRSVQTEIEQKLQLQELNKKLEEVDARKDEFISVAAHELRAPMTAIRGYLSMIAEGDSGEIPEKTKRFLLQAIGANDRLIRLVNNMLNVARIEEGRLVFNMGYLNLGKVALEAFGEFKFSAQEKNLAYDLKVDPNVADLVFVDQDRIHEVLSNYISNAIKYTDEGGIVVSVSNPREKVVRFEVTDTGFGISTSEQAKLFSKFYRAESNIGKVMGTGLGLYISKLLIEKFNGQVGLASEVGKGSRFWFELPVSEGQ